MGYLQGWFAYLVSVKMASKILRLTDVKDLDKTFLNAWKSGKVCCPNENCFSKRLLLPARVWVIIIELNILEILFVMKK